MRKGLFFFMTLMFLSILFAEEDCKLTEDGQFCEKENGLLFLSPAVMNQTFLSYLVAPVAPPEINPAIFRLNGAVQAFTEDIQTDSATPPNIENYTIFSLTNFMDDSGRLHDIVPSVKGQGFGDCTRFASTAAIEIEVTRLFINAFQFSKDAVINNLGNTENVEINLSEAYAKELNGCENNTISVLKSTINRGAIQEEHYPYFNRSFGEANYYSKREVDRFDPFANKNTQCTSVLTPDDSWNHILYNDSISSGWLHFVPQDYYVIREGNIIETTKNYINNGKPVILTYNSNQSKNVRINNLSDSRWGKFRKLQIRKIASGNSEGHAVAIIGYMFPTDGSGTEYFIIKNSWGDKAQLEAIPVNQMDGAINLFQAQLMKSLSIFGDVDVSMYGAVLTEQDVIAIDSDSDGIPDLFDNYSFSDLYNSYSAISSLNPAQNEIDNDSFKFETDVCPYTMDTTSLNMDMNSWGDFCDEDIDGDGISNVNEGFSNNFLFEFVQNGSQLTANDYAALNPFLNGENNSVYNEYFITACFTGNPNNCNGACTVGGKYISDLCFYHSYLDDAAIGKNGTFKFFGAGEAPHSWYKAKTNKNSWTREYTYIKDGSAIITNGIKWNIPGYFEMKDVTFQEYAVNSNYGENWPESYYNCVLHCKMIKDIYSKTVYSNLIDVAVCESACTSAYNCDENMDADCDGIRNKNDNCPFVSNPDQSDSDIDPVTSEPAPDEIGDVCDNCLNIPNGWVPDNSEIIVASCENGIGGAACLAATKDNVYRDGSGNYYWQPDHDLDGIGDACDPDVAVWSEFRSVPLGLEKKETLIDNDAVTKKNIFPNTSLSATIEMESNSSNTDDYTATTRFCWLTPDEYGENYWGDPGFCTTEAKYNPQGCIIDFGYSHGSDPKPADELGAAYWKEPTLNEEKEFTVIPANGNKATTWNWRQDFIDDNDTFRDDLDDGKAPLCTEYDEAQGICISSAVEIKEFYYTMSTGVKGSDNTYLASNFNPLGGNENVNPGYFKNQQRYTRSQRLRTDPVPVSYYYYIKTVFHDLGQKHCNGAPCNFPIDELMQEFFLERLRDVVTGPDIFEKTGMEHFFNNRFGSDMLRSGATLSEWSMNSSGNPSVKVSARPQLLATVTKNINGINTGLNMVPQNGMQLMNLTSQNSNGIAFNLVEMDKGSNGDWRTVGRLNNIPEDFNPVSSANHQENLYVVSHEISQAADLSKIYRIVPIESGINTCTGSSNIFEPVEIGTLYDLGNITIHSLTSNLIVAGEGANGMEIYKLVEHHGDYHFENITGTVMPSKRNVYTAEVKDDVLYLAGGVKVEGSDIDLKTDIWKFTESAGWTLVRNDLNLFPGSFRIDFDGTDIILTNRIYRSDATTERVRFSADGSGDTPVIKIVTVEGIPAAEFDSDFCIYEKNGSIFPGTTNYDGECISVYDYDYETVSYFDYKYTVAGYKNDLYLGGLTGVRRVEISADGSLTDKEMLYSGETNNLAVYGNAMYGANYGEVDIYSIAEAGSISRVSGIGASSCKNVRTSDGKLFTAENKKVRIFNLTNPLSPQLVKTITTAGTVIDLEVVGNKLYIYEETTSWFTTKGFTGIYDITNLNSPVRTKYFEKKCTDAEMQKSGDKVYLGCKNGQLKITDTGLITVTGEKNFVREGYAYDGVLYQVFSGALHKSKTQTKLAVCGNGIIEPSETCDGDTVQCSSISSDYIGGTAACNSTCDGYNENACESDGW